MNEELRTRKSGQQQEQISPTTAVEAYLQFVLNDLSQATNQMLSAAAELRLAASALEQKEMELAVKIDEVGSRLLIDIKRRASVITEEELRRYRAAIGVQGVDLTPRQEPATPTSTKTSASPASLMKKERQARLPWWNKLTAKCKRWLGY